MKIGILTYHRTHNYGGCLQALATRLFLEQLGHEVYYVDYWPDYHKRTYAVFNKDTFNSCNIKGKLCYVLNVVRTFQYVRKRQIVFESFLEEYIYPFCKPITEKYDIIIYGSDQIWRKQYALNDYNPVYFGENTFQANKHISYAASMGILPQNVEDANRIASLLKNLDVISVREKELKDYIESLGFNNISLTIDPTLLLDAHAWDKVVPNLSYHGPKYILIYALWGEVFDMKSINALAKRENLIVKVLRGKAIKKESETEISLADPIEFLRLIKNAEYVFSSSFHGLVFSIIYHKQVYASFKVNGGRARSLLDSLDLSDRYLENYQMFPSELSFINYEKVEQRLNDLRRYSAVFLKTIVD